MLQESQGPRGCGRTLQSSSSSRGVHSLPGCGVSSWHVLVFSLWAEIRRSSEVGVRVVLLCESRGGVLVVKYMQMKKNVQQIHVRVFEKEPG